MATLPYTNAKMESASFRVAGSPEGALKGIASNGLRADLALAGPSASRSISSPSLSRLSLPEPLSSVSERAVSFLAAAGEIFSECLLGELQPWEIKVAASHR